MLNHKRREREDNIDKAIRAIYTRQWIAKTTHLERALPTWRLECMDCKEIGRKRCYCNQGTRFVQVVLVINLEVKDNHEEAAVGARLITLDICQEMEEILMVVEVVLLLAFGDSEGGWDAGDFDRRLGV
ncbi:hypothetical protein Sjap_006636 [Stephania japonica]|uniref:RNA polymerase II subunit A C-terminal domain phosphatase SSU72 n=1 Tax=Stephania japonica TaxID=461633 RepID=A0AAP0K7W3_9MAGN